MQVMGPEKAYLVQHTDNTRIFWADKHELVLGACFKGKTGAVPRELLDGVNIHFSHLCDPDCLLLGVV